MVAEQSGSVNNKECHYNSVMVHAVIRHSNNMHARAANIHLGLIFRPFIAYEVVGVFEEVVVSGILNSDEYMKNKY